LQCVAVCGSVWQCVAVCCSVVQHVAACCSVLQCVAVCCSRLYSHLTNIKNFAEPFFRNVGRSRINVAACVLQRVPESGLYTLCTL